MVNKNILLIAYTFPPFGQTASRRSGCMAKYLPEFGWEPTVLTREWTSENGPYDPTIVTGIPEDVTIYRISCITEPKTTIDRLSKRIQQTLSPQKEPVTFYTSALQLLPELVKKHTIDVIWATFPTMCNLALADQISRATTVPWVADLRDVYQFIDSFRATLMQPIRLYYLNKILKSASTIITVSDGFGKTLQRRNKREIAIIPNGFDTDVLLPEKTIRFPKFEILYTGGINLGKPDFTPLLDAIQFLCTEGKLDVKDVLVFFFGKGNEKRLKDLFKHPFSNIIQNGGTLPAKESSIRQRNALILLQAAYPGTGCMTSKIYEYLVACRPILAIPRDGDHIEKLLKETNAGVSCSTKEEIATQLLTWYTEWKNTGTIAWHGNMQSIMQYSRKEQVKKTAEILEEVTGGH
jgi:glycosyltransferase involved in cell wall biosynthesis